ncbi:MAG: tRNA (adenosine(37)-N6)-threonylcarbamoyltransferase complex ATPase subunit type 1 TsaE [Planctomycetota bacterium]
MDDLLLRLTALELQQLDQLATELLDALPCPIVVGLTGTLGAGKTTFAQAIARGAGIDHADVTSPTFTLLQSYHVPDSERKTGPRIIHHLDAYRVADEEEFLQLGVDELFEQRDAWTLIEWADRVAAVLPEEMLWIELIHGQTDQTRDIQFHSSHPSVRTAVQRLSVDPPSSPNE